MRNPTNTPNTDSAQAGGVAALSSATLLSGKREIRIDHRGETYCLRETRNGKLILTK